VKTLLSSLLTEHVKLGSIASNPIAGLELAPVEEREPRYLDLEELLRLAHEMPTARDAVLTQFLGMTGARFGEAAALRIADIDLERSRAVIRASLGEVNGKLIEGRTKSRRIGALRIPSRLVALLEQQIHGRFGRDRLFAGTDGEELRAVALEAARVWPYRGQSAARAKTSRS
jgi:integrase